MEQKEKLVSEKLEWIRLKKKLTNFEDLNPLMINIEAIYTLPCEIEVTDEGYL